MTRCYEYYCMIERDPKKCTKKHPSKYYIERYKLALKAREVKFDFSPEDKVLFQALTAKMGSEYAFCQELDNNDENFPFSDFKAQIYNVWNFNGYDPRFGLEDFEGRIPGQIIQNVLHYFTQENDLVVDPMAGSGTTYDVCVAMNRKPLCYDLDPKRKEIVKHDIRNGYPDEAKNCDLVFLDPPYFNMVFTNFKEVEDFYRFIDELGKSSYEAIKKDGIIGFLIQDMTEKGSFCLSGESYRIFRRIGFECLTHISCPLSTEQFRDFDVARARREKRMLGRNRDLYIFRRG